MKAPENKAPEKNGPEKNEQAPGMVFPCEIDVKIFIRNCSEDEARIRNFAEQNMQADYLLGWGSRESSGGKYLAVTVQVYAQSREHIDVFYQALNDHDDVIMMI